MIKFIKYLFGWLGPISLLILVGFGIFVLINKNYLDSRYLYIGLSVYLINVFITLTIFAQNRRMAAQLSWIMVGVLIPLIGNFLYLLFGKRYKKRMDIEKYNEYNKVIFEAQLPSEKISNKNIQEIFHNQSNLSQTPVLSGDIDIYNGGDKSYKKMFDDLRKAKSFIHLCYYIIKKSEIWDELKSILISQSKNGVKIKLIVDDFGRWALPWYELSNLRKYGIEIKVYGKVHFPFISSNNGYRNHRKYVIIDGEIAHTGGLNISNEYAHFSKKYGYWVDAQMRISGKAARTFSLLFIKDWRDVTKNILDINIFAPKLLQEKNDKVLTVFDGHDLTYPRINDAITSMIQNAKTKILISTPYFIPTVEIIAALRIASMSGISVTIYLPGVPDKKSTYLVTNGYARELMKYGVVFKKYQNAMLHSKIGLIDDKIGYVGTVNLDNRSMYSQHENITFIFGDSTKELNNIFADYDKKSLSVSRDELKIHGIFKYFKLLFIKFITPIM